jgi:hypothetical protein
MPVFYRNTGSPILIDSSREDFAMPRKTLATLLPLLAALAVLSPRKALAGPPERVSEKMAFDEVADGLRKYRQETDHDRRVRWLRKLAPTCDVRVAVALAEAWGDSDGGVGTVAQSLLAEHYCKPRPATVADAWAPVTDWWKKNGADLRRRAKLLPQ